MLEIQNLSKKFKKQVIIDNLSTTFSQTGTTVIVGVNGSGKTTLLNMITNLLQPDSGQISLDGLNPGTREYKSKFFYLPSDFYLPGYMTGKEYAHFVLSRYDTSNHDQLSHLLHLLDMTPSQNKTIESYSFGMKKKIQIAVAIAANTDYIVADEILGGLDFDTVIIVQEIFAAISDKKKIIIVSHERNTIDRFPEDVRLMREGTLTSFTGSPDELTNFIKQESVLHDKLVEIQKHFMHS
ncbi:ATP-binding cassette domain-containing protein [Virgibacillus flavescens]|uniref:ATP-binding cassette domain-containing protein n=1 Tax=Virgibacillus flavescens TaxID=1611422 RepID=UPI003D34C22C